MRSTVPTKRHQMCLEDRMSDPVETEIKLGASAAMLAALRVHPLLAGPDTIATLVTTYFDTPHGHLRQQGAALRMRDGGKCREQTLKLASVGASGIRRAEWSVPIAGDVPEPSGFPVKPAATLARLLNEAPLLVVAKTRIKRTSRTVRYGASIIELAFDTGTIEAGSRSEPVCELELELVDGRLADVIGLALELPLGPELQWSVASKAERCHAVALGNTPAAVQAVPGKLSTRMNSARGFQAIAWNCLEQLLANYAAVIASDDPEAVHQTRVAIRRLRAAFSLFGSVAHDEQAPILRAELKAAAAGLGPSRDLHVLIERISAAAEDRGADAAEMLAHLGTLHVAATQSAREMLASTAFQRLLFQLASWIEAGEWLETKGECEAGQPLPAVAAQALSRRRRKLRHLHNTIPDMTDAGRHRLRINVKKLRYAAEFLAPLYRDRPVRKKQAELAKALAKLQDSLGKLNDMAMSAGGREELFADLAPIAGAGLCAQLAELLDARGPSRHRLLKAAQKALDRVNAMPAWWKGI